MQHATRPAVQVAARGVRGSARAKPVETKCKDLLIEGGTEGGEMIREFFANSTTRHRKKNNKRKHKKQQTQA